MAKFGIGQAVKRVEDQRFLTGQGQICRRHRSAGPGLRRDRCFAACPCRDQAASTPQRRRPRPACSLVLTGADAVADKLGDLHRASDAGRGRRPPGLPHLAAADLNADRVRYVGDRVAFVVAETAECRRAMPPSWSKSSTSRCPAVVDVEDAAKDGRAEGLGRQPEGQCRVRPDVRQQGRNRRRLRQGQARHVKLRVEHNRLAPNAMEPRVAIGDYSDADEQYTLYTCSQNPHGVRMEMSHIFHVPRARSAWSRPTSAAASG